MNNISNIKQCFGCGVCATICPKKIISISLNKDGFYTPQISELKQCIDCGLCIDVCAYHHKEISMSPEHIDGYAAWSNDTFIRKKCSSGGLGFELGRTAIKQGYKVCGVKYNAAEERAEHYIATTVEELIPSIGSKYIQSYTLNAFKAINKKEKYLITGTPCQIDSFRRYIRKLHIEDNFILMDFFCHSVPSIYAWKKYLQIVEKITGKVTYASWRNKTTGWHDSYAIAIDGSLNNKEFDNDAPFDELIKERKSFYNSRLSQGDLFFQLFLGDFCSNNSCAKDCKYKNCNSAADIRIGDLWGKAYKDNEEGVSALLIFTPKGEEIIKQCNCTFIKHPIDIVTEDQLKKNIKHPFVRPIIMYMIKTHYKLPTYSWRFVFLLYGIIRKTQTLIKKLF